MLPHSDLSEIKVMLGGLTGLVQELVTLLQRGPAVVNGAVPAKGAAKVLSGFICPICDVDLGSVRILKAHIKVWKTRVLAPDPIR